MSKKLWGGRFAKKTDPLVEKFTKSIHYDYKLAEYDVIGSITHVQILKNAGYLTYTEAFSIIKELILILQSIRKGLFKLDSKSEDIHSQIQNMLEKKLGDLVLKLHTARSRNDQVIFATKIYCKWAVLSLINKDMKHLINSITKLADENKNIIIPGFTHLQHAQPVYLKDYFGAYESMLRRDVRRLLNISQNIEIFMGAGALAGTPIVSKEYNQKIEKYIREIGIDKSFNIKPTINSLDAVSDRDFVIEIISALSIIAMHLSRLAEDLIIWSTKEFDFIEIDEAFCTGSSLMPQKKNPDVLELVRGYASRLYGNLVSVLTMMKGLPLTYNRDMQLDKEPLFNSFEIVSSELKVLSGLIKTLKFNKNKIKEHLKDESLYATDLVYYLVKKGESFKKAHDIVGKLVKDSLEREGGIQGMSDKDLKRYCAKFVKSEILKLFDPLESVRSKKSIKR
jgi:argininosuccinate lyase